MVEGLTGKRFQNHLHILQVKPLCLPGHIRDTIPLLFHQIYLLRIVLSVLTESRLILCFMLASEGDDVKIMATNQ